MTSEFRSGITLYTCADSPHYHRCICSPYRTPRHEVVRPEAEHRLTPTSQPVSTSVWSRRDGCLGGTHMLPTLQRLRRSVTSSASTSLQNRWVDISTREHTIIQNSIAGFRAREAPKFLGSVQSMYF